MVKRQHKIMCLVLCLMLAVSTVFVGVVSASAATGDTVYVRVNNGWSKVNCYMWTDGLGNNASWPGKAMTKVEDGVYSYTLDKDYTKVIFNTLYVNHFRLFFCNVACDFVIVKCAVRIKFCHFKID